MKKEDLKFVKLEQENEHLEEAQFVFSFPLATVDNNGVRIATKLVPVHVAFPMVSDSGNPETAGEPLKDLIEKAREQVFIEVQKFFGE